MTTAALVDIDQDLQIPLGAFAHRLCRPLAALESRELLLDAQQPGTHARDLCANDRDAVAQVVGRGRLRLGGHGSDRRAVRRVIAS